MTGGEILGTAVAGASVLSALAVGASWVYGKVIARLTPETAFKLPELAIPAGDPDE